MLQKKKLILSLRNGALNLVIRKRALNTIGRITEWYTSELNPQAAQHFSFLLHPKYRIVYRFTKKTLYVVAIRATMKKYQ